MSTLLVASREATPVSILYGHTSQETARVVTDYPYGSLRCSIRYWVESHPKKGMRLVTQTNNPKRKLPDGSHPWNAPKTATYANFAVLYLDDQDRVHCASIGIYSIDRLAAWLDQFGSGLPPAEAKRAQNMLDLYNRSQARTTVPGAAYTLPPQRVS